MIAGRAMKAGIYLPELGGNDVLWRYWYYALVNSTGVSALGRFTAFLLFRLLMLFMSVKIRTCASAQQLQVSSALSAEWELLLAGLAVPLVSALAGDLFGILDCYIQRLFHLSGSKWYCPGNVNPGGKWKPGCSYCCFKRASIVRIVCSGLYNPLLRFSHNNTRFFRLCSRLCLL